MSKTVIATLQKIAPAKTGGYGACWLTIDGCDEAKLWTRIEDESIAKLLASNLGDPFQIIYGPDDSIEYRCLAEGTLPLPTATIPAPTIALEAVAAAAAKTLTPPSAKAPTQTKAPAEKRKGKVTVEEYMALEPPTRIAEWDYQRTVAALSRITPPEFLKEKTQGGQTMKFLSWHRVVEIANRYTPGWEYRILETQIIPYSIKNKSGTTETTACIAKVEITIHCADGSVTRQQQGIEIFPISGYGDASSNALSMAMRRAFAMHGLGLFLYGKAEVLGVEFDDAGGEDVDN